MSLTRRQFDDEITDLSQQVLVMGQTTEEMVRDGMIALRSRDLVLADSVLRRDDVVDSMEQQIEAHCHRLLALQQPMASDLRLIGATLKIITDMERIADHAVDISRIVQRMPEENGCELLPNIIELGKICRVSLQEALDVIAHRDPGSIDQVIRDDAVADRIYSETRSQLQERMQQQPGCVVHASYQLFVAHYLERISDHCTNIAERVSFLETGYYKENRHRDENGREPVFRPA